MKDKKSKVLMVIDAILVVVFIAALVYFFEIKDVKSVSVDPQTQIATYSVNNASSTASDQQIQPLSLLYAVTQAQQELGLGQRASLPADEGMLFVFSSPGYYAFWMKDMQFPIDMIWLDQNFKITNIASNVSPGTYPESFYPPLLSSYVLETNAGYAKNNNLSVGETLDFVKNSVQNKQ